jgi:hypothetical protein
MSAAAKSNQMRASINKGGSNLITRCKIDLNRAKSLGKQIEIEVAAP